MDTEYLSSVFDHLRGRGIEVRPGLSQAELRSAEERFGLRFPPDLGDLLRLGLPVGRQFPDWRAGPDDAIRERLVDPLDGILFDVERSGFWMPGWGPRPGPLEDALAVAESLVRSAPVLIPVFSHRYLPAEPCEAGNPIFSVVQTDIIHYGLDLADYLRAEFDVLPPGPPPPAPRVIRFWSDLVSRNDELA